VLLQIAGGIILAVLALWVLKMVVLLILNSALSDRATASTVPAGAASSFQDVGPTWKKAFNWCIGAVGAFTVTLAGMAAIALVLMGVSLLISHL
jgi:hypothetical protein